MRHEQLYPTENIFYSSANLTPEDRQFLRNRKSFFDGLKEDSRKILSALESLSDRLKKIEEQWK